MRDGCVDRGAQRTAVRDECAEKPKGWLCWKAVQRGPEDGCAGQLCGQRGPEAETGLLPADSL